MGNRYEEIYCDDCAKITTHRITRKFGHTGDKFHRRRQTTKCLMCQSKIIDNAKRGKIKHNIFISYNKEKNEKQTKK